MPRSFGTTRRYSRFISEPAAPLRHTPRCEHERGHARGGAAQGVVRRCANSVRAVFPYRTRRSGRAHGPQRRRQIYDAQSLDGPDPAAQRQRALPGRGHLPSQAIRDRAPGAWFRAGGPAHLLRSRSEEHTSELQSLTNLVCRLLLEKKKDTKTTSQSYAITTQYGDDVRAHTGP